MKEVLIGFFYKLHIIYQPCNIRFVDETHYRLTASCSIFSRKHVLIIEQIFPYLACVKKVIITARYLIIKQITFVETCKIIC